MVHPGLKGIPQPSGLGMSAEQRRAMQAMALRQSLGAGLKIDQRGRVTLDLLSGGALVADPTLRVRTDQTVNKGVLTAPTIPQNQGFGLDAAALHDDIENEINRITEKTLPTAADLIIVEDAADKHRKKKVQLQNLPGGGNGIGDVLGPGSSVDTEAVVFDGTTGKLIKGGTGVKISATGAITGVASIAVSGNVDGRDVSTDGAKLDGIVDWAGASAGTIHITNFAALQNLVEDTTPQLGGGLDINGKAFGDGARELLTFVEDGSAVNHLQIENQAAGGGPILRATGDDAAVDLHLDTKGTGNVKCDDDLDVTGAITVTGTVDGRDVAADGTALDSEITDSIHDNVSAEISAVTEKTAPVPADLVLIEDSDAGNAKKRVQIGKIGGMLGTVEKVVELDLGTLTSAGFNVAHGITDWDKTKFSFVMGFLRSATFGLGVEATVPGVLFIGGLGLVGLTLFAWTDPIDSIQKINFSMEGLDATGLGFNLKILIGYTPV